MPLQSSNLSTSSMIRVGRRWLASGGCAMFILLLASVASADPYCDPSDSDCLVTTEIFVDHPIRQRLEVPLPLAKVEVDGVTQWTDEDGVLQALCNTSSCLAKLSQDEVAVEDQCPNSSDVSRFSISGERPIYPCSTDCAVPQNIGGVGNTWSARTAFHWVEQSIQKAKLYVRADDIPTVTVETNHTAATHSSGVHMLCAGFWDAPSKTIELFQSGGGCGNSGETTIAAHEWAHALYDELYSTAAPGPIDEMTNEAQADVHAALVSGDTCIGRGIRPGQRCKNCRLSCDGLRDLEAFSLWSSKPAKQETVFDAEGMDCPQGLGPLGAAPHCESLIASTAFMDLVKLLRMRDGDALGTQTAEELFYHSLSRLISAYGFVNGATTGCEFGSWYEALLWADDELNGDDFVHNGTPNACLIYQAFEAHGIACNPPIQCSRYIVAGPDQETCKGSPVSIGPSPPPTHDISWLHAPTLSSPVPVVSHTPGLQTYTMKAVDRMSLKTSTDQVSVRNFSCEPAFFDDFEGGMQPNWEMTGLWHHVVRGVDSCQVVTTGAMYFGLDTCNYETCRSVYGDLTSDVISVPTTSPPGTMPALTFVSQRDVEKHSDPITTDRAEVWIEEWPKTPTSGAELRWARSSADELETCGLGTIPPVSCPPSSHPQPPWHFENVAPISLQAYAGKNIRVRFHFDSLDGSNNHHTGWLIDNVKVDQVSYQDLPLGLAPPTLTLVRPGDGDVLPCCKCATFEASAVDALGNDISDQVVWTSDINGRLGAGRGIRMLLSPTLPLGQDPSQGDERQEYHTITASVIDRAGQRKSLQFTLKVPDDGQACELLLRDPAEQRRNCAGMGDR